MGRLGAESFLDAILAHLRSGFYDYLRDHGLGEWRQGCSRVKLDAIDHSVAWEGDSRGRLKSHIKREVYREKEVGKLPTKARLIQANATERGAYEFADEYRAWSMSLKSVSREVHHIQHVEFRVAYCSGMTLDDVGDFVTAMRDLAVARGQKILWRERDGVNWDSSRQKPIREFIAKVYAKIDKHLGRHAQGRISAKGSVQLKNSPPLRYTVEGTVKSGDPDTSSGNSADNIESVAQSVEHMSSKYFDALRRVEGLVLGDDLLAGYFFDVNYEVDVDAFGKELDSIDAMCGIEPESRIFDNPLDTSFISASFYPRHDGTIAAGPKIGRMLSGLLWTHVPISEKRRKSYTTEVAQAFLPFFGDCPLLGSLLKMHTHSCSVANIYKPYMLNMMPSRGGVDWNTYFEMRYRLLPGWEDRIVRAVRSGPPVAIWQDPVTDVIIDQDLADPMSRWLVGSG